MSVYFLLWYILRYPIKYNTSFLLGPNYLEELSYDYFYKLQIIILYHNIAFVPNDSYPVQKLISYFQLCQAAISSLVD